MSWGDLGFSYLGFILVLGVAHFVHPLVVYLVGPSQYLSSLCISLREVCWFSCTLLFSRLFAVILNWPLLGAHMLSYVVSLILLFFGGKMKTHFFGEIVPVFSSILLGPWQLLLFWMRHLGVLCYHRDKPPFARQAPLWGGALKAGHLCLHCKNPTSNEVGTLCKTNKNRLQCFPNTFQLLFNWIHYKDKILNV